MHKETNENQKIIYNINNKVIDVLKNDSNVCYGSFPRYSKKQYNFGN